MIVIIYHIDKLVLFKYPIWIKLYIPVLGEYDITVMNLP